MEQFISEEVKAKISLKELQTMFLHNVDHELRTPVTIIQGYAHLLADGALGLLAPEQEQAVQAIMHRAHDLRILAERITTLLTVKAQAATCQVLTLSEIVTEVVENHQARAMAAGVALRLGLEPLPPVWGQPYHFFQAVDCLVDNALKFTPAGGQIEVSLQPEAEWVCLRVTDSGVGIAADKLAHIFNPFYQGDGSSTRAYGGLGLGLAVVKLVAEGYGGWVEVKSQPGQGSCFSLKLPVYPAATFAGELQSGNQREAFLPKKRILIVDDEIYVAATLQAGLEILPDCEVMTATGGEQALALFGQNPFDLLITDYKMPDMDGLTLAEQIRRLDEQVIIIMITAFGSSKVQEQAADAAIKYVLSKPVELNQVRELVAAVLRLNLPESTSRRPEKTTGSG